MYPPRHSAATADILGPLFDGEEPVEIGDVPKESVEDRKRRERHRILFDEVSQLYNATRQEYPAAVVDKMFATSRVDPGAFVLEVGCGTGQLTRDLAARGVALTAIDIGPSMVKEASRNVDNPSVSFVVTSFEDLDYTGPCELIVSATAFHWVDPEVGLTKASLLLQPRGWLALLTTGEQYDEPLRSSLRRLWETHNPDDGAWSARERWADELRRSLLFGAVTEMEHERRLELPADRVSGVERTRATFLSYDDGRRNGFAADLHALLASTPVVTLTQKTTLAMAQVV